MAETIEGAVGPDTRDPFFRNIGLLSRNVRQFPFWVYLVREFFSGTRRCWPWRRIGRRLRPCGRIESASDAPVNSTRRTDAVVRMECFPGLRLLRVCGASFCHAIASSCRLPINPAPVVIEPITWNIIVGEMNQRFGFSVTPMTGS